MTRNTQNWMIDIGPHDNKLIAIPYPDGAWQERREGECPKESPPFACLLMT